MFKILFRGTITPQLVQDTFARLSALLGAEGGMAQVSRELIAAPAGSSEQGHHVRYSAGTASLEVVVEPQPGGGFKQRHQLDAPGGMVVLEGANWDMNLNEAVFVLTGLDLELLGEAREAIAAGLAGCEEATDHAYPAIMNIRWLLGQGRADLAAALIKAALEATPEPSRKGSAWGQLTALAAEHLDEGESALLRALDASPADPKVWRQLLDAGGEDPWVVSRCLLALAGLQPFDPLAVRAALDAGAGGAWHLAGIAGIGWSHEAWPGLPGTPEGLDGQSAWGAAGRLVSVSGAPWAIKAIVSGMGLKATPPSGMLWEHSWSGEFRGPKGKKTIYSVKSARTAVLDEQCALPGARVLLSLAGKRKRKQGTHNWLWIIGPDPVAGACAHWFEQEGVYEADIQLVLPGADADAWAKFASTLPGNMRLELCPDAIAVAPVLPWSPAGAAPACEPLAPLDEDVADRLAEANARSKVGEYLAQGVTPEEAAVLVPALSRRGRGELLKTVLARVEAPASLLTAALAAAVDHGRHEAVGALVGAGADVAVRVGGRTLLAIAVKAGDLPLTKALLASGADPNDRGGQDAAAVRPGQDGDSPLVLAITGQRADLVEALAGAGARVN